MGRDARDDSTTAARTFTALAIALAIAGGATALNLPGWIKHHANPVLPWGAADGWDSEGTFAPSVLYDGHTYHMWYVGAGPGEGSAVGYATSPDGITWTRHAANPVLSVGDAGSWDSGYIGGVTVVRHGDGTFTLWYVAWEQYLEGGGIGMATSPDGVTWTKHAGNPVLTAGGTIDWDATIDAPSVVFDGTTYHLWYVGLPAFAVGYATSPDGIAWTRHADNPVVEGSDDVQAWNQRILSAAVFADGGTFHMLYAADSVTTEVAIGYANSPDGAAWTRRNGVKVLTPGAFRIHWDACNIGYHGAMALGGAARVYYTAWGCASSSGLGLATVTMNEIAVDHRRVDRLDGNRFMVSAVWWDPDGNVGDGVPVRLADDTGSFWFFDEANLEITVKVLDGCAINDRFWVFASGMTNVGVTLSVRDTVSGETVYYNNDLGTPFQPVQDTAAFDACD